MARSAFCLLLIFILIPLFQPPMAVNPAPSNSGDQQALSGKNPHDSLFETIALWQQQLKGKMATLVRDARTTHEIGPLLAVIMIAFGYGVLHAAGPGHGKAVAMSFVLSRNATLRGGLLFGALTAFSHGFSGVICVLGIRYVLQQGFFGTFDSISRTTQIVSFSLIALLGFGILMKSGYSLFVNAGAKAKTGKMNRAETPGAFVPWAVSIGLVPCPGVVMVLLFCLSMNMLPLGILLAGFISLGMACTVSAVVVAVIKGKELSLRRVSKMRMKTVEDILGLGSGIVITALGLLFLGGIMV